MHSFWWHLWNDPLVSNSWSLCALMVGAAVVAVFLYSRRPQ